MCTALVHRSPSTALACFQSSLVPSNRLLQDWMSFVTYVSRKAKGLGTLLVTWALLAAWQTCSGIAYFASTHYLPYSSVHRLQAQAAVLVQGQLSVHLRMLAHCSVSALDYASLCPG